jgi:endonuclease YncB( thermonuclease family)
MMLSTSALAHPGGVDEDGCHNDKKAGEHHCHQERLIANKLATCDLKKPPKAGNEGVFYGPLVRVIDGDTFDVKVQGVVMKFRLAETDAPESTQPYGDASTKALRSLLKATKLVLVPIDTDRYGRTVAFVWNNRTCINKEMIRLGHAWFYDEFARNDALFESEKGARATGVGLWNLPLSERIEPWVWREEKR